MSCFFCTNYHRFCRNYHRIKTTQIFERHFFFEIETIHVPVADRNEQADSYTRIIVPKSYIATNDNYYITLMTTEMMMCKEIRFNFYCEELFIVKHVKSLGCASTLLLGLDSDRVMEHCKFNFYYNISVPPSVLDGGNKILLANIDTNKETKCHKAEGLPVPMQKQNYAVLDRSILCTCMLDMNMNFLLRDLNSCQDQNSHSTLSAVRCLAR